MGSVMIQIAKTAGIALGVCLGYDGAKMATKAVRKKRAANKAAK